MTKVRFAFEFIVGLVVVVGFPLLASKYICHAFEICFALCLVSSLALLHTFYIYFGYFARSF